MSEHIQEYPHDLDAERAILGAILRNGIGAFEPVRGLVAAEDFYQPQNMRLFAEFADMAAEGVPIEAAALIARIEARIMEFGGLAYLGAIDGYTSAAEHVRHYAEKVRDLAVRRAAIINAREIEQAARAGLPIPPGLVPDVAGPGWAPPIPLGESKDLPAFPVDALPRTFARFVAALALETQAPADLAGVLVLGALATAAGGRGKVEAPKGWRAPLNLFLLVALAPGERKSPNFNRIIAVIRTHEAELRRRAISDLARLKADRDMIELRIKKAKGTASGGSGEKADKAREEAKRLSVELANMRRPIEPQVLCDDVTPEKLASLLAEHGRMSLFSEEGGIFQIIGGQYSSKGEPRLDVFLKGWDGGGLNISRIGRVSERADNPALTIALAVQPDVVAGLARHEGFRGRGLLGRFLYALPRPMAGYRDPGAPRVDESVETAYAAALGEILDRDPGEDRCIKLSGEAAARFTWLEYAIEPRLRDDTGDLSSIKDWAQKLVGHVLRIAGLLHLAEHAHDRDPWAIPVSRETMDGALRLGEYLIPHALAAYGLMGADPALSDALRLLGWLARNGHTHFKQAKARSDLRGHFKSDEQLNHAIRLLVEHGFIRRRPTTQGRGRTPSPIFEVNPLWSRS